MSIGPSLKIFNKYFEFVTFSLDAEDIEDEEAEIEEEEEQLEVRESQVQRRSFVVGTRNDGHR